MRRLPDIVPCAPVSTERSIIVRVITRNTILQDCEINAGSDPMGSCLTDATREDGSRRFVRGGSHYAEARTRAPAIIVARSSVASFREPFTLHFDLFALA